MKCPRCVQRVHRSAMQCPHCGFDIADVDRVFGEQEVRLKCLTDAAGVMRKREREAAERALADFQRKFPQLFFAVYFGTFRELPSLRQFGFWLLNRGAFEDVDVSRPNEGGILLSVDVGGKSAGISFGYLLQPFLDDDLTFTALSAAHPFLLQGHYLRATEVVVERMTRILKRQSRRVRRDPERLEAGAGDNGEGAGEVLERIRANHRSRQPKL
ncbi:MAG: hypothetical protein HKN82_10450 [Akkermansiaceae bacterium]|nr:hypothetical protein [Akkermansiaceae bacterium]